MINVDLPLAGLIKVRKCVQCGYLDTHPIRWCSNCGGEYQVVTMKESEYRETSTKIRDNIFWRGYRGLPREQC